MCICVCLFVLHMQSLRVTSLFFVSFSLNQINNYSCRTCAEKRLRFRRTTWFVGQRQCYDVTRRHAADAEAALAAGWAVAARWRRWIRHRRRARQRRRAVDDWKRRRHWHDDGGKGDGENGACVWDDVQLSVHDDHFTGDDGDNVVDLDRDNRTACAQRARWQL